jgi:hypothetical protein
MICDIFKISFLNYDLFVAAYVNLKNLKKQG